MAREPSENGTVSTPQSAAVATIARVLAEIGVCPARVDVDADADGGLTARVVIEPDVCEMLCTLTREGDLLSARLIAI